jgi:P4 family phage/plasmid primase-like protien
MKSEKIIDDVIYLCRSLGFSTYKNEIKKSFTNSKNEYVEDIYYNIQIFGYGFKEIPSLLERDKEEEKEKDDNHLLYEFEIVKVSDNDNYFGFLLDSNHRYLLKDFSCTHNSGSNGKSKLLELFALAFGDYADQFPITLFTGKRAASNAASPEVADSKGKRFMQSDEPEEGANINVGLMKQYTGGDPIKTRALYREPITFRPQFKIVLVCNDLPKVPAHDGGVWRRLEIVEFVSKFVEDPKEENEFPRDNHLSEKLKKWKESFMSILLEYYKLYRKEGLKPPCEVTKYTKQFQKECDAYDDFVANTIRYTGRDNDVVSTDEIFREFKMWHTNTGSSSRQLDKKDLIKYLIRKLGKTCATNEFVKGYQLIDNDNMISNLKQNENDNTIDNVDADIIKNENELEDFIDKKQNKIIQSSLIPNLITNKNISYNKF